MAIDFRWALDGKPGIQKDTTPYNTKYYLDGVWTRFYNSKPKKMGGYGILQAGTNKIIRDVYTVNRDGVNEIDLYIGRPDSLSVCRIPANGFANTPRDRTPIGFAASPDNTWSFAQVTYDLVNYILAVAVPNLNNINNGVRGVCYYGRLDDDLPLTPILGDGVGPDPIMTTGGMIVIGSIIFVYDKDGNLFWNNGRDINGTAVPADAVWPADNSKTLGSENFIYGDIIRNGDVLGALAWAIQGLAKITFNGYTDGTDLLASQPIFDISYVSFGCTLLSSSAVVFYDPYYYWPGKNSFFIYTGVVDELPNDINRRFFFENLATGNNNKVFGFPSPEFQEVWWGWANGLTGVTENNHGLIYNKNYKTWFDTPRFNRSCGVNNTPLYPYPILGSSKLERAGVSPDTTYPVWKHEFGKNIQMSGQQFALPASIQFRYVDNPNLYALNADDLILDIVQTGNLTMQLSKQGYPRTTPEWTDPVLLPPTLEHITMRETGNLLSLKFTSNEVDGDYYFGNCLLVVNGDEQERPGPVNV